LDSDEELNETRKQGHERKGQQPSKMSEVRGRELAANEDRLTSSLVSYIRLTDVRVTPVDF
jgi:hypothetical protein